MKLIPIRKIKKWQTDEELIEHCKHIITHRDVYSPSRVFEAKEIINNLRRTNI